MSSIKTDPCFEEESYCNFAAFLHLAAIEVPVLSPPENAKSGSYCFFFCTR
jgi:hypothetical protein